MITFRAVVFLAIASVSAAQDGYTDSAFRKFLTHSRESYVDKTLFIRTAVKYPHPVIAIFRPRQSGKSLNLDMLKEFIRKDRDATDIFKGDWSIMSQGNKKFRSRYMNRYPVIFINLDIGEAATFEMAKKKFHEIIQNLIRSFQHLALSNKVGSSYNASFNKILASDEFDKPNDILSVWKLSDLLNEHYGVGPFIIIDEVDSPVTIGTLYGYFEEIRRLIWDFLQWTLKNNKALVKGVVAGVIPVRKGSYLPDKVRFFTVHEGKFDQYFGFTENDVEGLLRKFKKEHLKTGISEYYKHYQVGKVQIYNPASIMECLNHKWLIQNYATPSRSLQALTIHFLTKMGLYVPLHFQVLMTRNNETLEMKVESTVAFEYLLTDESNIWEYFIHAGMLTSEEVPSFEVYNLITYDTISVKITGLDMQMMLEKMFVEFGIPEYKKLAEHVQNGRKKIVTEILAKYINQAGVYLFGRGQRDVRKVGEYVQLVFKDWTSRFGKCDLDSNPTGNEVILTFSTKSNHKVMVITLQVCQGLWQRIKNKITFKNVIARIDGINVILSCFQYAKDAASCYTATSVAPSPTKATND